MSKLMEASQKTSTTVTKRVETERKKEVPKGAEIISSRITTATEEIENGYLTTKDYSVDYKEKGSDHTQYAYYTKKWYTKEDPLTIDLEDKELAEAFED